MSRGANFRESVMPSYDPNNIFAKILRGELPAYKVYEDDRTLAFLDIMPQATGHTLVIPKAPSRNMLDADPDDLAYVVKIAQKIAKVAMAVFSADGLNLIQFNEPAAGQTVYHLHVHVIPRQEGVPLRPHGTYKEEPGVLAEQAAKLAAALKGAGA
jgi:histidine triad (HIT) family protein